MTEASPASPRPGSMRSAWNGELRAEHAGTEVTLCGWVDGRRDLGGLVFIDLRDRTGLTQVVLEPDEPECIEASRTVRAEFALQIVGKVMIRDGAPNKDIPTGEIEVRATSIKVLSPSEVPAFVVTDEVQASEELRLSRRYLDLRRPRMQQIFALRHRAVLAGRNFLAAAGLLEIETPILFKSTPEGARDYLVPSRVNPGRFYALPQSPQILKQVLMVSGFDGYYQMARCFRDEDLRANRQPEFTQMDMEISFCTEEDVFQLAEGYVKAFWKEGGYELETPFPRLSYADAMSKYGSDKPDLRFGLEFSDLSDILEKAEFRVVADVRSRGDVVHGLAVPGGAALSRKKIDALTDVAKTGGAMGLVWIKCADDKEAPYTGGSAKFFSSGELNAVSAATGAQPGDLLLMVAAKPKVVAASLGAVRLAVADELDLRAKDTFAFAWVQDFPLYDENDETGELSPAHHPFCMPREDDMELLESDPGKVRARSYDLVCNGEELGSGSIRIHRPDIQARVFERLGMSDEEAQAKFGFFLDALKHGAPPHAGIALGVDRMVMLVAGTDSIRDVIAFPKTASAADLMADCPSSVSGDQLDELGLALLPPKK